MAVKSKKILVVDFKTDRQVSLETIAKNALLEGGELDLQNVVFLGPVFSKERNYWNAQISQKNSCLFNFCEFFVHVFLSVMIPFWILSSEI